MQLNKSKSSSGPGQSEDVESTADLRELSKEEVFEPLKPQNNATDHECTLTRTTSADRHTLRFDKKQERSPLNQICSGDGISLVHIYMTGSRCHCNNSFDLQEVASEKGYNNFLGERSGSCDRPPETHQAQQRDRPRRTGHCCAANKATIAQLMAMNQQLNLITAIS